LRHGVYVSYSIHYWACHTLLNVTPISVMRKSLDWWLFCCGFVWYGQLSCLSLHHCLYMDAVNVPVYSCNYRYLIFTGNSISTSYCFILLRLQIWTL